MIKKQETVRLLLLDNKKRMLFVRKTVTQMWHWPGGKRKPKEPLDVALEREAYEETGLLVTNLIHFHTEELPEEIIHCYTGLTKNRQYRKPDGIEIDSICRRTLSGSATLPLTGTQKLLLRNIAVIAHLI